MNTGKIKEKVSAGEYDALFNELYPDCDAARTRVISALDKFKKIYGEGDGVIVVSVSGRTEICGNHTDHNGGMVIAGSVDRDIIAVARCRDDEVVNIKSEGRYPDKMTLTMAKNPDNFDRGHSASMIAGVLGGFMREGHKFGGFDAYTMSDVPAGSGLSSSAAFECVIGSIINHLYLDGALSSEEIAKIGQFAENVYFGKPSGLLDQMACATGGAVYMDFADAKNPVVKPIPFPLSKYGYSLLITATGGSHADLGEDYASVPKEMLGVAEFFGKEKLAFLDETEFYKKLPDVRSAFGDRAALRAIHFFRENARVLAARDAILAGDIEKTLSIMRESGHSSFEYLQNVYTNKAIEEQGISLALALTDGYIKDKSATCRVHGGGFAGTIQAVMKNEDVPGYIDLMESVFGKGAVMVLTIRPRGAVRLI